MGKQILTERLTDIAVFRDTIYIDFHQSQPIPRISKRVIEFAIQFKNRNGSPSFFSFIFDIGDNISIGVELVDGQIFIIRFLDNLPTIHHAPSSAVIGFNKPFIGRDFISFGWSDYPELIFFFVNYGDTVSAEPSFFSGGYCSTHNMMVFDIFQ